jgi:predicted Zn-ribbon and HTH transcriptional regulator
MEYPTETIRQQIMSCVKNEAMNAIEISRELGISEKEVYEHLPHIAHTLSAMGKRLVIHPSQCMKCGYEFGNRRRFTRPGRCPQCRGTHIRRPAFEIG